MELAHFLQSIHLEFSLAVNKLIKDNTQKHFLFDK